MWASEDYLEICFERLVEGGNYITIYAIWRSKEVRERIKVIIWGDNASQKWVGVGGGDFCRGTGCLTMTSGYCKRFYRIPLFPMLFILFFLLFEIVKAKNTV